MMVKPNERNKMEKLPNCYAFIVQTKGYYMIVINMIFFILGSNSVCVCVSVFMMLIRIYTVDQHVHVVK